jgi:TPR repeat protein
MLAAWGTRGVTADVTKAKSLYARARDLGITRAQMRLDQLR